MKKVCIQGLGFVGSAMSIAVANAKNKDNQMLYNVVGIDLDNDFGNTRIDLLNKGIFPFATEDPNIKKALKFSIENRNFKATSSPLEYKNADIVLVDIHLDIPFKDEEPKLEFNNFINSLETIGMNIKENCLVIIETTVPPGTCEKIVLPCLQKCFLKRGLNPEEIKLAHSYERVMPGEKYYDSIVNFWRVYSGINDKSADECKEFLSNIINTKDYPLKRLSSTTSSETAKLLENTYRTVNIAFIAEWTRYSEKIGLDLFEIIDAIQQRPTHRNIRYPGIGIGGYCLTKDPAFAPASSKQIFNEEIDFPFSKLAIKECQKMPIHAVDRLKKLLNDTLDGKTILICGVSYREDVADTRFSPAEKIYKELKSQGANIECHDPYVEWWNELEINVKKEMPKSDFYDAVIFTVPHKEYKNLDLVSWVNSKKRLIILDGFMVWSKQNRIHFRKNGVNIEAIGVGIGL